VDFMHCTRCEDSGFLNLELMNASALEAAQNSDDFYSAVLKWIETQVECAVSVCDCCGDGKGWHDEPGIHNESTYGNRGPYAYNGGLPECY
jgi:hypothetical protein